MRFPLSLNLSMTSYLLKNKLSSNGRYPIILMLEPTHACNLSCEGCGRIREYGESLKESMSVEECLTSVKESNTPIVTITGGEPLMYPHIDQLVRELIKRRRHIYLCTNGILLKGSLHKLIPTTYLNINVHIDGLSVTHDRISGRTGVFKEAVNGIKKAKEMGFRVCTNTSIYKDTDMDEIEALFAYLDYLKVDGMSVAPAFGYEAVDNDIFLSRDDIHQRFRHIYHLSKRFKIINTPLYLKFLKGDRDLCCTPWGNPTRNPQGWKSPCYLITDTHYPTFRELMEKTEWEKYGNGNDPRCSNCMMHCGFEPTVVREVGNRLSDIWEMIMWNLS